MLASLPLLVLACLTASGRWPDFVPNGDVATIELDVHHALHATQQTGTYSRYGFRHPGPLAFYLLAPAYWLSGCTYGGLSLGTTLLNLASVLAILLVVYRFGGFAGLLWTALLLVLYLRFLRLRRNVLFLAPLMIILPWGLEVVLLAALAVGRLSYLPAALLVASFLVQTHVGCVVAVAVSVVVSLCSVLAD